MCQDMTALHRADRGTDWRTEGHPERRQMQWNVPYQHAHKSNISNKHFCRWLRIIIIKNASYTSTSIYGRDMDMHIPNICVCGPRRRMCTTHNSNTHDMTSTYVTYTYLYTQLNEIKFCTVHFIFCICV